jgi:hypothetical protein
VSAITAARARAVAVPAGVWLGGIVVCSIVVRVALGHRMVAPWIMVDEIVYSELAKNIAAHGEFLVRGVPSHGYGFVYPVLIAPAWKLFSGIPEAYTAAKALNAVFMSLAAIPAYFLARRLLPATRSLLCAGLTVLIPSMLYTAMLMTENAFYPLFLLAAFLLVLTLEAPTAFRQIALLFVCAIAFETRAQAVALFAAVATAPVLLALIERRGARATARRFAWMYGLLGGAALLALAATTAAGRSPLSLLGAYRAATSSSYTLSGILHFFLYHVSELDLYLGILPFAALVALWLAPRRPTPGARAFAAASLAISVWLVAEVSAFASASYVNRIEERNTFYLAPLALIALVGLSVDGVITRRRRVLVVAALFAGILPFFIPYTRFINASALSDTFALLPWWWAQDNLIHLPQVRWAALAVSLAAGALFVFLPRRYALVLPALIAVYFIGTTYVVENGRHGIHKTTVNSLWSGTHMLHPDWIDRLVGQNAAVSVLWTETMPSAYLVYENEFFNRSVRTVYDVAGAARPDPLPETPVSRQPNGELAAAGGRVIHAQYVLASGTVELAGERIASDPAGVDLYRVNGPIVIVIPTVHGLYPNGTWSGRTVTYQQSNCTGGSVSVQLLGDSRLFTRPQTVVATENGSVVRRTTIPVRKQITMTVPLRPASHGRCLVDFTVGRTLVPARVEPGSTDTRPLGAHFLNFNYNPT